MNFFWRETRFASAGGELVEGGGKKLESFHALKFLGGVIQRLK